MEFPDEPRQPTAFQTKSVRATRTETSKQKMKKLNRIGATVCVAALMAGGLFLRPAQAAEDKKDPIKEVMKTCHKAPKGEDPICKRAVDGKASADEIKKLVAGYKELCAAKPPKGDEASWKAKTGKLLAAAEALQKNEAGAAAKYKDAVNCKACHEVHKPE